MIQVHFAVDLLIFFHSVGVDKGHVRWSNQKNSHFERFLIMGESLSSYRNGICHSLPLLVKCIALLLDLSLYRNLHSFTLAYFWYEL